MRRQYVCNLNLDYFLSALSNSRMKFLRTKTRFNLLLTNVSLDMAK